VALAAKSFGDITANRVGRIFGLAPRFEVPREVGPLRHTKDVYANPFGELPHDQLGEVTHG